MGVTRIRAGRLSSTTIRCRLASRNSPADSWTWRASPDETKTSDVTGINVISSPSLFTIRAPHSQLTAQLVCTFCVRGTGKTDDGRGGLATTVFPRKWPQTEVT